MSAAMPIEAAKRDLEGLLARLQVGETITLLSPEGAPVAVLISLKPTPSRPQSIVEWLTRWDTLTQRVSQAWKSDKSAVETLSEMRR